MDDIVEVLKEICIQEASPDGVVFDPEQVSEEDVMTHESEYVSETLAYHPMPEESKASIESSGSPHGFKGSWNPYAAAKRKKPSRHWARPFIKSSPSMKTKVVCFGLSTTYKRHLSSEGSILPPLPASSRQG